MPTNQNCRVNTSNPDASVGDHAIASHRCNSALGRTATRSRGARTWQAVAAYLYILHLDTASLAWEYLRRNADYRRDWERRRSSDQRAAQNWRLAALENPEFDARRAQPLWRPQADEVVRLVPNPQQECGHARPFSLWPLAGRKTLCHDGHSLVLTSILADDTLRIAIADELSDGVRFAYVVSVDAQAERHWRQIKRCQSFLGAGRARRVAAPPPPPGRGAVAHMRYLQALDGVLAGASQREIAATIFGATSVNHGWHNDGELRAQVRHLIRRGREYTNGGYLRLIESVARRRSQTVIMTEEGGR